MFFPKITARGGNSPLFTLLRIALALSTRQWYKIMPKIQQRSLLFMKLGIVESEPVSETLRKRTNADKA